MERTTEYLIGGTLYIVKSECSPTATETAEKKLERLILRHISDTKSYQKSTAKPLAMCGNQSEYRKDTIL